MTGAAGWRRCRPAVEPAAFPTQLNAAGSFMLRRVDRWGHQEGPCAGRAPPHALDTRADHTQSYQVRKRMAVAARERFL